MKTILATVLFFLPILAMSQRCKIKKDIDEMAGITTYIPTDISDFVLLKTINTDKKNDTSYAAVITVSSASSNYSAKGYLVKFDDGTIFKDKEVNVDCTYESSYNFRMEAYVKVDQEFIAAVLTKKIVKLQLDIYTSEIGDGQATKFQKQAKCMVDFW